MNNLSRLYVHFVQAGAITVVLTNPSPSEVITDGDPTLTWTISAGTQQAYRAIIYSDAAGTLVVYDSGWVVSATLSATIPGGVLQTGETYYAEVTAQTTDGLSGTTDITLFTTDFATSVDVTGLHATVIDACVSDSDLPRVNLRWTQVVPGAGETFTSYIVRRREPPDTEWTALSIITAVGTVTYVDRSAAAHTTYQYSVVWLASAAGGTLVSADVTGIHARLAFDYAWAYLVEDPTVYMPLEAMEFTENPMFDVALQRVWGKAAPVGVMGESEYKTITVQLLPQHYKATKWTKLLEIMQNQRDQSSVICYRHGRGRTKMFCQAMPPTRRVSQKSFDGTIQLVEVDYTETQL